MNNSNLIQMMAQAKNFEAHRKKIAQIMNASSIKATVGTFDNKRIKVINTFYSNRDRSVRYALKSKQEAVQKENDLILRKIIEVNNRRSNTLNTRAQGISHNSMANLKKSMQNINIENQKIAHKLVSTSSDLRQQKQYESFKKHLERKERLKKYEFDEDVGMVIPKKIKSLQKLKAIEPLRASTYRSRVDLQYENEQR